MSEAYRAEFARVVEQVALAPGQKFEPVPTLTAEQVRQIVREELERALRPAAGRMPQVAMPTEPPADVFWRAR